MNNSQKPKARPPPAAGANSIRRVVKPIAYKEMVFPHGIEIMGVALAGADTGEQNHQPGAIPQESTGVKINH